MISDRKYNGSYLALSKMGCLQKTLDPFILSDSIIEILFDSCPFDVNQSVESINNIDHFKWKYLYDSIIEKLARPGVPESVRIQNALDKLSDSEECCHSINHSGYGRSTPSSFFNGVMHRAQQIVANVLGPVKYDDIFAHARFTSGATTSRRRKHGDSYFKYHPTWSIDVTVRARPYLEALIGLTPGWASLIENKPRTTLGNKVTTVPKKTDVDRAIAMEPDGNAILQNAVGTYLKSRLLKTVGVNLRDQTTNQDFARLGSATGIISTLDLSAASDSISDRLVWDLLPPDWYNLLNDLRSHYGIMPDGTVRKWEKFSAMGNGFTFELESLLFYAISRAVAEFNDCSPEFVNIYGDDIIIPTRCALNLVSVLSDLGFTTNRDKSFIVGLEFRESCGEHFYKGVNVSPFYVKKTISSLPTYVWFLNSLRHWAYSESIDICCPSVEDFWFEFRRSFIPKCLLGGNQIHSITSVYSKGEPRKKICFEKDPSRTVYLHGRRALLRYFQNNQIPDKYDFSYLSVKSKWTGWYIEKTYESQSAFYSRDSARSITRPNQPDLPAKLTSDTYVVACLKANLDGADPYSSSRTFIFPKEMMVR
uniref:RNA-directed RNA polymerase n=1 Tax=Beihai levi-like virus 27 TaxID=1922413 RepID=A0A1L3KI83_9VIRU|nr:hypothetical protein [Beihai levi-like virus 27]